MIEFDEVDVDRALGAGDEESGDDFSLQNPRIGLAMFQRSDEDYKELVTQAFPEFAEHLKELHAVLARDRLHFGYRVIDEIVRFVGLGDLTHAGDPSASTALDFAFCQKVLPKLSGGREIEQPLLRVLDFMLTARSTGDTARHADALDRWREGSLDGNVLAYPRSAAKTARMLQRLADTGFVSAFE